MMARQDKDAAIKGIAGRLVTLSFRDMGRLATLFDARAEQSTSERLLAVADEILGPDYNPNAPAMRGSE